MLMLEFIKELPEAIIPILVKELTQVVKNKDLVLQSLFKKSPILIFDEATSALDNESEKVVQDSWKFLQKTELHLLLPIIFNYTQC